MGTGTANLCDEPLLQPGSPCIIFADKEGFACSGMILSVNKNGDRLSVVAVSDGTKLDRKNNQHANSDFKLNGKMKTPSVDYVVYPNTASFCELVLNLVRVKRILSRVFEEITAK